MLRPLGNKDIWDQVLLSRPSVWLGSKDSPTSKQHNRNLGICEEEGIRQMRLGHCQQRRYGRRILQN
jgi:hypothetical protein